jgi:hypothetical protein
MTRRPGDITSTLRYTVYSKTRKSGWHAVTLDLEKLAEAAGDGDNTEKLLTSFNSEAPAWVLLAESRIELNSIGTYAGTTPGLAIPVAQTWEVRVALELCSIGRLESSPHRRLRGSATILPDKSGLDDPGK